MTIPAGGGGPTAERFVDLHSHSTASDGAHAPADVAARARAAGLTAIALTDHDTLAGVAAAQEAGRREGVRVIAGVELSAMDGEREVHLLGLHIERVGELEKHLEIYRAARTTRAEQMVARLNALGLPVTMDAVLAEAGSGAVGRPHLARALVAGGWVGDIREAFDRYLGNGRPACVPKERLSIGDAIRLVHDAGGLAVVAHPGPDGSRANVEAMVRLGLDGLEVRHPSHSATDVTRLMALVDHFKLVPSGGSDWHGAAEGLRALGSLRVPHDWLDRQEARLDERRGRERVA